MGLAEDGGLPSKVSSLSMGAEDDYDYDVEETDPFAEIRSCKHLGHEQKAKRHLVLGAIEEVIRDRAGKSTDELPSPTEYFAAMMTALEAQDKSHIPEVLSLLSMVIGRVPQAVLRLKFGSISVCLARAIKESDAPAATRAALSCLGKVVEAQEVSADVWKRPQNRDAFRALLSFLQDKRPKVRHTAHEAIAAVLRKHRSAGGTELPAQVAKVIESALAVAAGGKEKPETANVLQAVLPLLPSSPLEKISLHLAASCLSSDSRWLVQGALQTLSAVFADPLSALSSDAVANITAEILCQFERMSSGAQATASYDVQVAFCKAVAAAVVRLTGAHGHSVEAARLVPRTQQALSSALAVEAAEVQAAAAAALAKVVDAYLSPALLATALGSAQAESEAAETERTKTDDAAARALHAACVQEVLSGLQALLSLRHQSCWAFVLPVLSLAVRRVGLRDACAVQPMVRKCVDMHEALQNVPGHAQHLSSLSSVIASGVEALGAECFLQAVPIADKQPQQQQHQQEQRVLRPSRVWLLPLLATHIRQSPRRQQCSLQVFQNSILPLARQCRDQEQRCRQENAAVEAKTQHDRVVQLWRLFPAFCAVALDAAESLPSLSGPVCGALADEAFPELAMLLAQGLARLLERSAAAKKGAGEQPRPWGQDGGDDGSGGSEATVAVSEADVAVAAANCAALASQGRVFLPILLRLIEQKAHEQEGLSGALLNCTKGFVSLAPSALVHKLFRQVLQRLLESTVAASEAEAAGGAAASAGVTETGGEGVGGDADAEMPDGARSEKAEAAGSEKRRRRSGKAGGRTRELANAHQAVACAMLDVAEAMAPVVDQERLHLLYRTLKPQIQSDAAPWLQKRSYRVLQTLCAVRAEAFLPSAGAAPTNVGADLVQVLRESLMSCSVTARAFRLRCLGLLVEAMDLSKQEYQPLVEELVPEVILCNKERNLKARNAAFQLLLTIAHKMVEADKISGLQRLCTMVLGSLAATTPHMRSAGILCLSRLMYEFMEAPAMVSLSEDILKTVMILLREKSREVVKAALGLVKLAVAVVPQDRLEAFLPQLVEALMIWVGDSKNRFRIKIRYIVQKLIKKFGPEKILSLVPEKDRPLIKHIQKTKEREERQKGRGGGKGSRDDEDAWEFGTSGEEEEDDEEEDEEVAMGRARAKARQSHSQSQMAKKAGKKRGRDAEDDVVVREDASSGSVLDFLDSGAVGRMAKASRDSDDESDAEVLEFAEDGRLIVPDDGSGKKKPSGGKTAGATEPMDEDQDEEEGEGKKKFGRGGQASGGGAGAGSKRSKLNDGGRRERGLGSEYRSKKAKGDMKKKGKLEPYAYVPLDPRFMSRKKRREAAGRFGKVGKKAGKGGRR